MNYKIKKTILFSVFLAYPFFVSAQYDEMTTEFDVNLTVLGCNNNSICEANLNENNSNCPLDCTITEPSTESDDDDDDSDGRSGSRIWFDYPFFVNSYPEVSGIKAIIESKNIQLFWLNPSVDNFNFVRIVKNNYFTESPYDGEVVYEGILDNFKDTVTDFDKNYYYNFFARYNDGGFSKAVVLVVNSPSPSIVKDVDQEVEDVKFEEEVEKQILFSDKINIFNLTFFQDKNRLRWKNGEIEAILGKKIEVYYPKKDFFGEVDNIYLYLDYYDRDNKFFRKDVVKLDYLSLNQSYFAQIEETNDVSRIDFRFSLINKNFEESFVRSSINFEEQIVEKQTENFQKNTNFILIISILLILISILFFKLKKRDN